MKFPSIRIEGSIFSSDILEKIEQSDIPGQLPKDFGFESNVKVKDEIAVAWADANSFWKVFKSRTESLKEGDSGTSETRKYWIIPFLGLLGYDIENYKFAQVISGKNYAISHFAANLDNFPVHIMGVNDSLDKKRESGGPRMSPHSLLQEYINLTEYLYAILSNGLTLRLLRDSSRLVKLSYIEFDLEKMFEEDQFTDFAVLFRLLHSSRMPSNKETASESLIERYHLDALESGERIRSGLSLAVENSIKQFGIGFLNNPSNAELIKAIEFDLHRDVACNVSSKELLHSNLLRLIYRILFLMVIEERGLVYTENADKNLKEIYYNYYSVSSIRKISELKYLSNRGFNNLWIQLKNTFLLFENEHSGKALGLKPLAGDLFGENAIELLRNCDLENKYLLDCLNNLNFYSNDKGQKFRVNYAALSVEEFGSVYEGLLEFKPAINKSNGKYEYTFAKGSERSKSGSHYTPDELVQPLIKHSLDFIIEDRLKEKDKEKALLSITVLDISCGSGHILLNAARRIAIELAKARSGEDQPNPSEYRKALKDVIKNCIYGVDKNPLAVELCKVALWLESHIPGEPLNFLDHKIKCGDSIVGLAYKEELEKGIATEAFKTLPGDNKAVASEFRKKNTSDIKLRESKQIIFNFKEDIEKKLENISNRQDEFSSISDNTLDGYNSKKQKYDDLQGDKDLRGLKLLSNIRIAQFFIPKTIENRSKIITDYDFFEYMNNEKQVPEQRVNEVMKTDQKYKFFHWFLEFTDVFLKGGFDCILSNPPYLGGSKISTHLGDNFFTSLINYFPETGASCDLATYFMRRIYSILKPNGYFSVITTNTISQGNTREGGLEFILKNSGEIVFAQKSIKWPGVAAVHVSLISIKKGIFNKTKFLNNHQVNDISPQLSSESNWVKPNIILENKDKSFTGSKVYGEGFILNDNEFNQLSPHNEEVIFRYLNGDDINSSPALLPSRYTINFQEWPLNKEWDEKQRKIKGPPYASDYPECLKRIELKVKPFREKMKGSTPAKERWWIYERTRPELYRAIKKSKTILVCAMASKHVSFVYQKEGTIFMQMLCLFDLPYFSQFAIMSSILHIEWAWKYSSTLGSGTITYSLSDCFQTFPFPQNVDVKINSFLDNLGKSYNEIRNQLMLNIQLGLTKTYNQFHSKHLSQFYEEYSNSIAPLTVKDIEKKFGKETSNLVKHFKKGEPKISLAEAIEGIEKLRQLHVEMDNAVLEAYGWQDIELKHDFYEVDYLPENDRVRFTIHPDARREILKRLLELNHKIYEEEVKAGLWEKKKTKGKKKTDMVKEPEAEYGLFEEVKGGKD